MLFIFFIFFSYLSCCTPESQEMLERVNICSWAMINPTFVLQMACYDYEECLRQDENKFILWRE